MRANKGCYQHPQEFVCKAGWCGIFQANVKPGDRRALLDVRQHIKNVEALREEHELHLDVLNVALRNLQELGANVDSSNRALKKISEKRKALE